MLSPLVLIGSAYGQAACVLEAVAGGGDSAYGEGGPALEAELWSPDFIRRGPDGLIYFADVARHRIFRVTDGGRIETVVGTGEDRTAGDGELGPSASVGAVRDLEFGPDGTLYWLEFGSGTTSLRRLPLGGWVDTVAGGAALDFSGDGGPAVDAGIHDTVDFAIVPDGSIYLAYRGVFVQTGGRIRRISPDGVIQTVAGGGEPGATSQLEDMAKATEIVLGRAEQVLAMSDGSVLVRQSRGGPLRRLTSDGKFSIVRARLSESDPDALVAFPIGDPLSVDREGRIYWTTRGSVFRTDAELRPELLWSSPDLRFRVTSVTSLADGSLWTSRARQVERLVGESESEVVAGLALDSLRAGDGGPSADATLFPAGVAGAPNGGVYIADTYTRRVRLVRDGRISAFAGSGGQGQVVDGTLATEAPISGLSEIVSDRDGNLFINTNFAVLRVSADGIVTRYAGTGQNCSRTDGRNCGDGGPAADALLGGGLLMALDSNGVLYLRHIQRNADSRQENVLRRVSTAGVIETMDVELPEGFLNRLVIDSEDRLVVFTSSRSAFAYRLGEDGFSAVAGPETISLFTTAFAAGSNGSFYSAGSTRSVLRILPDGSTDTIVPQMLHAAGTAARGGPVNEAILGFVHRLSWTEEGDLLIADSGYDQVWRIGDVASCPATLETTPIAVSAAFLGRTASGGLFSMFGEDLGPEEGGATTPDSEGRYPREVAGTEVWIGGRRVPLLYVSSGQINGVLPATSELNEGFASITFGEQTGWRAPARLRRNGIDRPPQAVSLAPTAPALFALAPDQAAALNQNGTINGPDNPAIPGSVLVLFGTGGGDLDPPVETGRVVDGAPLRLVTQSVSATLAGRAAEVLYAGAAPGLVSGVLQVNVLVPEDIDVLGALMIELTIGPVSSDRQRLNVTVGR